MTKSFTPETLLHHLVTALGLGSVTIGAVMACGGSDNAPVNGRGHAGRVNANVDANVDSNSLGGSGGTSGDVPPPIAPPPPFICDNFTEKRDAAPDDGCIEDAGFADPKYVHICFPPPAPGKACPTNNGNTVCLWSATRCASRIACGPFAGAGDTCCYVVGPCVPPPPGRPFIVAGKARVAPVGNDASWSASIAPAVADIDDETRAALAEFWTEEALTEHASVASFSRFVLQCLSLGAPADIVADAQRACIDEIEHARVGFALASAYAGRSIGPGRLDIEHALDDSVDPLDIACSVAAEGCVAELVSAALLGAARDDAGDPVVRAALAKMADDELAHATLAWRYVGWAFTHGGDRVRRAVIRVFAEMDRHVAFGARTARTLCEERLRAHGYVPWEKRRRIAENVLAKVVRPLAQTLLVATQGAAAGDVARPTARSAEAV